MKSQDSFNEIKDSFEPETEIQNEILNLEKDVEKAEEIIREIKKRIVKLKDIAWDKTSKKEAKDMFKVLQKEKDFINVKTNKGDVNVNQDFMEKEKKHLDNTNLRGMITKEELLSFPKVAKNVEPEFSIKHQGNVWSVEANDGSKIVYGERTWDKQSHLLTAHSKTERGERIYSKKDNKQDRANGVSFAEQFKDRDCNSPALSESISNNSKKSNKITQQELDNIGKLTSKAVNKVLNDKNKSENDKNKDLSDAR